MKKPLPPSRTAPQFVIRFPDEAMRDRIKVMADERGRSMNWQIVHMLQTYLDRLDEEVGDLQRALGNSPDRPAWLDPRDSAEINTALLKVIGLQERLILMERVEKLGGTDAVLQASPQQIAAVAERPAIERPPEEAKSYFSKTVAQTPLTAVLTTEEIDAIAQRMVQIQQVHRQVVRKAHYPDPHQQFEDAVNGPPSDDPVVRKEQERRGLVEPPVKRDPTAMTKGMLAEPGSAPKRRTRRPPMPAGTYSKPKK